MKQTIESLEKELKGTQIKLEELISYKPVNNMGSWAKSVRVDSLKRTIKRLEKKIQKLNKS
jgi:hypothetical protein